MEQKLINVLGQVVRVLYDIDVLSEDSIMSWYRKGSNPKGRQMFKTALEVMSL
jgi:hypothetical protein